MPSFVADGNSCSFDHPVNMLFVHIPKCAGTYFFSPLNLLARKYSAYLLDKFLYDRDFISIFTGTTLDNEQILEG